MLVSCGPFWNVCCISREEGYPTFYNLILFMAENEQNIENCGEH